MYTACLSGCKQSWSCKYADISLLQNGSNIHWQYTVHMYFSLCQSKELVDASNVNVLFVSKFNRAPYESLLSSQKPITFTLTLIWSKSTFNITEIPYLRSWFRHRGDSFVVTFRCVGHANVNFCEIIYLYGQILVFRGH